MLPYAAQAYTRVAASFHWMVAIPLIGCVGTVLKAQQAPKEDKGYWMYTHKSLGLLTAIVVAPRLVYRVYNRVAYKVEEVQGSSAIETIASKAVHYGLYAFMIIMPATGVAMGYYGGKGLPFFYTTFSSPVAADDAQKKTYGEIAKNSFKLHKQIGTYGKYLVPLHVGGALQHSARGHAIFTRINPFRTGPGL
ncbi:Prokaryotic cytochrome b561 [Fragilaria crotonensis]|nr:Prokaryotic cytochrome b561 [Fragilaria crotonensis]